MVGSLWCLDYRTQHIVIAFKSSIKHPEVGGNVDSYIGRPLASNGKAKIAARNRNFDVTVDIKDEWMTIICKADKIQ